jgi:predicted kinase
VKQGRKVVLDATHLNEQRKIVLDIFRKEGLWNNELMLIYVDGGKKERIKRRLARKEGKNADGRSWVEAWETAYDYFTERIKAGKIRVPRIEEEGYPVVWVKNY